MSRLELVKKIYGDVHFTEKQLIQLFDLIDLAREQGRNQERALLAISQLGQEEERAKQLRERSTYF